MRNWYYCHFNLRGIIILIQAESLNEDDSTFIFTISCK